MKDSQLTQTQNPKDLNFYDGLNTKLGLGVLYKF